MALPHAADRDSPILHQLALLGTGSKAVKVAGTATTSEQRLDDLLGRFDGLLQRLEAEARRDGLHDDGPMTRVLEMLQLCMAILCQVTSLNVQTTERHAAQVVGSIKSAKQAADAAVGQARAEMAEYLSRQTTWLAGRISSETISKLKSDLDAATNAANGKTMLVFSAALVAAGLAGGWSAHAWWASDTSGIEAATRKATTETLLASFRDTREGIYEAFNKEGLPGARGWLQLMQWNSILPALAQCSTNPELVIKGDDGRIACKVPLWVAPPLSQSLDAHPTSAAPVQEAPKQQASTSTQHGLKPPRSRP